MASLTIDLRSVVDKFTVSGPRRCAICNRDFDGATSDAEEDDDQIPLLLWRDSDKAMLTLCFPCAEKLMRSEPTGQSNGRNVYPAPPDNPRCHCWPNGMACFFCQCGHLTECHWPKSCQEANCSHMDRYSEF